MKNIFKGLVVQVTAVVAVIAAFTVFASVAGLLFTAFDPLFVYLLCGAVPLLLVSVWYLRYKKITAQEVWECLWPFGMPW